MSFEDRFWSKAEKQFCGCWLWQGSIMNTGYGAISRGRGVTMLAHRVAYEMLKGPIPDGLQLDHLCRVRNCVNPEHLEPVTAKVNILRGISIPAKNASKTHCANGHALGGDNVITNSKTRGCAVCAKAYRKEYKASQRTGLPPGRKPQTHCKRGHEFIGHALRIKNGKKSCRICENDNQRLRRMEAN